MKATKASAPGKVILLGEHAVVYGHPAIAIPVTSVRTEATVAPYANGGIRIDAPDLAESLVPGRAEPERLAPLGGLARSVLARLDSPSAQVRITLHSTIPISRGMGSGAAASVAIVRALAEAFERSLSPADVADLAFEAEQAFHGTPSGIDNNVIAREQPIFFRQHKGCLPIETGDTGFTFVIADSGITQSTAEVVQAVRDARGADRAHYESLFWEIGTMACVGRDVIRSGSGVELGMCMNRNHELLQSIGVSCKELDQLVEAAREAGAAGAKLTGAGRGGNVVCLAAEDTAPGQIEEALTGAGAVRTIVTHLGQVEGAGPAS